MDTADKYVQEATLALSSGNYDRFYKALECLCITRFTQWKKENGNWVFAAIVDNEIASKISNRNRRKNTIAWYAVFLSIQEHPGYSAFKKDIKKIKRGAIAIAGNGGPGTLIDYAFSKITRKLETGLK